jgi:error-prone DNA polymerase
MENLTAADALASISGHRHQTQWQIMGLESPRPLLTQEDTGDDVTLPEPSVAEEVLADYQSTGLTLRSHPLALLRNQSPFDRCCPQDRLGEIGNRRFVRIAGLVTCRQRPGTASGVVFLTLEDETGNHNVIVWPAVQERCREALMTSRLLMVTGTLETRDNVTHVIAGSLYDYSHALAALKISSRDFH